MVQIASRRAKGKDSEGGTAALEKIVRAQNARKKEEEDAAARRRAAAAVQNVELAFSRAAALCQALTEKKDEIRVGAFVFSPRYYAYNCR